MFDAASLTTIRYEVSDSVATVTLNRPERHNAFTTTMCDELASAWTHIRNSDTVRCVVLTAAGDRAFCSGVERDSIADEPPYDPMTYQDPGQRLGPRANECWKPVIVAVNGMACGGAFYLIGEADFIIAADHATFFDPHITFGMAPVFETAQLLDRMPIGELSRMMLLGSHERISAQRAHAIGLVSEVVPVSELLSTAQALATKIASQPPLAVQATVRTLWAARDLGRQQLQAVGNTFLGLCTSTEALAQGQAAFAGPRIVPQIR